MELSCGSSSLIFHPLPNETRTRNDAKLLVLPLRQIVQRGMIQLFDAGQIQNWPETEIAGGMNELFEIQQVCLKKFPGNADRYRGRVIFEKRVPSAHLGVVLRHGFSGPSGGVTL